MTMHITSQEQLRALYAQPGERALLKQMRSLDVHCRRFIELAPFLVLATTGADGRLDASPRGGAPGFVKVTADGAMLVPDSPGNNRLDSLANIVATGRAGLLFMVPGFEETLRVNGAATLSLAPAELEACRDERRLPKVAIRIAVDEAYLHCAKALMRSRLWEPQSLTDRGLLPSMGRMIIDQTGVEAPAETQEQMRTRYEAEL